MALLAGTGLFILEQLIPKIRKREKMLSIARMDMCWNITDILNHCERLGINTNSKVRKRLKKLKPCIYTSNDFYQLLNFSQCDDIDYFEDTECTIIHDMNISIAEEYHQQYDLVIENGTIEHIFDQRTVLNNMAACVKPGGFICHISPLDSFNHGFYNYSVNLFHDYYIINGFDDLNFFLVRYTNDQLHNQNMQYHNLGYTPDEIRIGPEITQSEFPRLGIAFIGKKTEHVFPGRIPMQGAYDPNRKIGQLRSWSKAEKES